MAKDSIVRDRPELSEEECASIELLKRIWKLRWMGMQEEAEKMQRALKTHLASRPIEPADTLFADTPDTD